MESTRWVLGLLLVRSLIRSLTHSFLSSWETGFCLWYSTLLIFNSLCIGQWPSLFHYERWLSLIGYSLWWSSLLVSCSFIHQQPRSIEVCHAAINVTVTTTVTAIAFTSTVTVTSIATISCTYGYWYLPVERPREKSKHSGLVLNDWTFLFWCRNNQRYLLSCQLQWINTDAIVVTINTLIIVYNYHYYFFLSAETQRGGDEMLHEPCFLFFILFLSLRLSLSPFFSCSFVLLLFPLFSVVLRVHLLFKWIFFSNDNKSLNTRLDSGFFSLWGRFLLPWFAIQSVVNRWSLRNLGGRGGGGGERRDGGLGVGGDGGSVRG